MITIQATTAWIFLLCSIFIDQNVAEHSAHHSGISHHHDAPQRKHHNTASSGIQMPNQESSTSEASCISADSNIYEILHKANTHCKGNDMRCTFYHYSNHKYHNLGTIDVNKESFDDLLANYDNWLLTPERIDENNDEDSNRKVNNDYGGQIDEKHDSSKTADQEREADKINHYKYDSNAIKDTNKSEDDNNTYNVAESHHRKHKTKLTSEQKAKWKNGEYITVDPKFNDKHKYYELFLPKDKHKGDPRTIYVDLDADKNKYVLFDENINEEHDNDYSEKPIKVQLEEFSTGADSDDDAKFVIHDKHDRIDIIDHNIASAEDNRNINVKESSQKLDPSVSKSNIVKFHDNLSGANNYPFAGNLDTKLGNNDDEHVDHKLISDLDNAGDENITEDDDESHLIQLVETNSHHNDLNADNFTYKRTDTLHLKEPVFHVEKPVKQDNLHIFSLPEYTGHHSDGITDYTGYHDSDHSQNPYHTEATIQSLPADHDISPSLSQKTAPLLKKESTNVLETKPHLLHVKDQVIPGHVSYYTPKITTKDTPSSSHNIGVSPILASPSEPDTRPTLSSKYSPLTATLRSPPSLSRIPEMLVPCDSNSLSQDSVFSSQNLALGNEEYSNSNLVHSSSLVQPTLTFKDSNSFKRLPPVNPKQSFISYPSPLDAVSTTSLDSSLSSNLFPKSPSEFEGMSSKHPLEMAFSMTPQLGEYSEIYQNPQMPCVNPYSQMSNPSLMNLGLLNNLPLSTISAKPMYSQNNRFNNNPYITRPQYAFPCAEPFNPMSSLVYSPKIAAMNSPLSLMNENRLSGFASNSFLPHTSVNPISPLSLMLQRPNYLTNALPCSNSVNMLPYNNIPSLSQDMLLDKYHQIADNLALNPNLQQGRLDSLTPMQNIPLSVLEHPYTTTQSTYTRPSQSNLCLTLSTNQASPILSQYKPQPTILNTSQKELVDIHGESSSSYSKLPYLSEKPCLNLQEKPLVPTLDASLIGEHIISPIKPIHGDVTLNVSDELSAHTHFDSSLVGSELDTHIETYTVSTINEVLKPEDHLNIHVQEPNLIFDSTLTGPGSEMDSSVDVLANNETSIKITTNINVTLTKDDDSQPELQDQPVTPVFDNSLIGSNLPTSSLVDSSINYEVGNYSDESSLTNLIPLEESHADVESEVIQSNNITHEISSQSIGDSSEIGEPIVNLPSNLTGKELELETHINHWIGKPLDSSLVDTELDYDKESLDHEIESLIPPDTTKNMDGKVTETEFNQNASSSSITAPSLDLPAQVNVDLKPVNESPQLLDEITETAVDTHTLINITENGPNILEPELIEGEEIPVTDTVQIKESITTNEATEFVLVEEQKLDSEAKPILIKDNKTEIEAEEFIPAITSGMNIHTEIENIQTSDTLPVDQLNSSLVNPNLGDLTEEPFDVNFGGDLIGPTIQNGNQPSDIISTTNSVELESSMIEPTLEDPIKSQGIVPPDIISAPSDSLVGPGVDQTLEAPEIVNILNPKLNFNSTLLGPSLQEIKKPEILPALETGEELDDVLSGPSLVNNKDLLEDSALDSESLLDDSLLGPDLTRSGKPKEEKPQEFDETNSVLLDSLDTLLKSESGLHRPTSLKASSSFVSNTDTLPSELLREGLTSGPTTSSVCSNSQSKPNIIGPTNLLSYAPEFGLPTIDLTGQGLPNSICKESPCIPISDSYIEHEAMPVPINDLIKTFRPRPQYGDLHIPSMPFDNAPQYTLPCENVFAPSPLTSSILSPLTSSILNNRVLPSALSRSPNILSQRNLPCYGNTIPYSTVHSPSSRLLPLYHPNIPLSSPTISPEYLHSLTNPIILNALLNTPIHLEDNAFSPILVGKTLTGQELFPLEHTGSSYLPNDRNLHALPNNYEQRLHGLPYNLEALKSNIPCVPQKPPLSPFAQMNWLEPEILSAAYNHVPILRPYKNQIPISSTSLEKDDSNHVFHEGSNNYHNIESELNSFIHESINNPVLLNKLESSFDEESYDLSQYEEVDKKYYFKPNEIDGYVSQASMPAKPMHVAKGQQSPEFYHTEPELHIPINKPTGLPAIPSPKYRPDIKETVCSEPQIEEFTPQEYKLHKPSRPQESIAILPSKEQFDSYPYEIIPESVAIPTKTLSRPIPPTFASPLSYAKPETALNLNAAHISPCGIPPNLQEYTSSSGSENLPTTGHNRPIPSAMPFRPSKTYPNTYSSAHTSAPLMNMNSIPIEFIETPNLPVNSHHILAPNLQPEAKELPTVTTPLRPPSFPPPASKAGPVSPCYYCPTSPEYRDSYLSSPANIRAESTSLSPPTMYPNEILPTSSFPCPLSETGPMFKPQITNSQLMKAMNMISNEINPVYYANGLPIRLPMSPMILQAPTHSTEPVKHIPPPAEISGINIDSLKENELTAFVPESNLQKQATAAHAEVWNSNDETYEDMIPERPFKSVPYTLEPQEKTDLISQSKLNQRVPISYSQLKEPSSYPPIIENYPQMTSDMQWLPSTAGCIISPPSSDLSKPCPKLSPFISSLSQSSYLQQFPNFPRPSFLPSPKTNKLESLPSWSSPYYPAIVTEHSGTPITVPYTNNSPLLPVDSNVLENSVPIETISHMPSAYSSPQLSPYTKLPIHSGAVPTSYLSSPFSGTKLQSNTIPFQGLPFKPAPKYYRNMLPMAAGLPPKEYMPILQSIYAPPLSPFPKLMKPIPSPYTTSSLPIYNLHLESPICYEPVPTHPGLSKSPKYSNIIENLPLTVPPCSENIIRPVTNKLSPSNYAPYAPPSLEETIEAVPWLPNKPLMKPIIPQVVSKPITSGEDTTPISSYTQPLESFDSFETEPDLYSQYISKPSPKLKPDLNKYAGTASSYNALTLDKIPCQITDAPYLPTNKVQNPTNVEYTSEKSPILKPLPAQYTPYSSFESLPFDTNIKQPCLTPSYLNPSTPLLVNPSEFNNSPNLPSNSVPTNVISSQAAIESNILSPASYHTEEYVESCSPKTFTNPLQSLSLVKPLITPQEATPEILQEIPIKSQFGIPQHLSPNNPLLQPLLTDAYNPPFFTPQNLFKLRPAPPESDLKNLSKHQPIICNIDETVSSNAPIISELPDLGAPCKPLLGRPLKSPLYHQYQPVIPTEMNMTPVPSSLTSPYQEISPSEIIQSFPTPNGGPKSSSDFRPAKPTPIATHYGPNSIVENAPDIEHICPIEKPSYAEQNLVETSPSFPANAKNMKPIKQIQLEGFPISELFSKADYIKPLKDHILPSINKVPKSQYQDLEPEYPMPWVLLDNADKTDGKSPKLTLPINGEPLTPCEYASQTSENPIEAEYLKLAKLLSESKIPQSKYEKYTEVQEENEYEYFNSNLTEDNTILDSVETVNHTPKNVFKKSQNMALNVAQEPQNLAKLESFYANNHIGKSPIVCFLDPTRKTLPFNTKFDIKKLSNEITPDTTTNYAEMPSPNLDVAPKLHTNFFTPKEYLRSISDSLIEAGPIITNAEYLPKPKFTPLQMKYIPKLLEKLPENQYYNLPNDNIENVKYSGYKTYQIPTLKLSQKSPNIPLQMYYPSVYQAPVSIPKLSPIDNILTSSTNPETVTAEYQTPLNIESRPQSKLGLRNLPQSSNSNEYNAIEEIPVNADNFAGKNEIKNSIINYINSKESVKDKLYNNNEELTIPIGNIVIAKREPHTAKILQTNNPSIGLKVWKSNVKLVQAEIQLKINELSVNNFMPIINNLNQYDVQEIRKIIKDYIDEKYGHHIEINEPYTVDNQYTVIKDLNKNVKDNKFNLLWPTYYV